MVAAEMLGALVAQVYTMPLKNCLRARVGSFTNMPASSAGRSNLKMCAQPCLIHQMAKNSLGHW
jgi:hypothetical protein